MPKAIVSLSGGMDSAVVLASALYQNREVICVSFQYGSKHNPWEFRAAARLASHYGVSLRSINMTELFLMQLRSDLLVTGNKIPEGHYEAENMRRTVVPARNLIFLSVLAGIAISENAKEIYIGTHAGDHFIYPDCRPGFLRAAAEAISAASDNKVALHAPFTHLDKKAILEKGMEFGVPFGLTRTCYTGEEVACGKCGSCQERLEAFALVGADDPIEYFSRDLLPREPK